jgi:hypothetical protein
MEAREQKAARKKVAARLRDFYAQMRALADVDSEEFFGRVLQGEQQGANAATHEII